MMNSRNIIILILFSILGIGLFFSTQYDKKINSDEIIMYQCENNPKITFPEEYTLSYYKAPLFDKKSLSTTEKALSVYSVEWYERGLTGLPDDYFKNYPCIQNLIFSNNHFSRIPVAINDLDDLRTLNFSNNKITTFNELAIDYSLLKKLYSINLSHNRIDTLDFIPSTNEFLNLTLSHNQIKHLNLPNTHVQLRLLDLSNNQLEEFPPSLFDLSTLFELDLSNNKLNGELVFRDLRELEVLNISNQNNADSSKIEKLIIDNTGSSITELYASNNHIKEFSYIPRTSKTSYLRHLKTVDLSYNKFTKFPYLLYNNKLIKKIDLSNNQIDLLRFEHKLDKLQTLNLSYNQLLKIEQTDLIRHIEVLDLSHNQLIEFPLFKRNLILKELDLSHNKINDISNFLLKKDNFIGIKKVNLSHNNIQYFEKSSVPHKHLKQLNLAHNQLSIFYANDYYSLENLDLSNNSLEEILCPSSSFSNLKTLNLRNNSKLKSFPERLISKSKKLSLIDIRNTNLDENFLDFLIEYCETHKIELVR